MMKAEADSFGTWHSPEGGEDCLGTSENECPSHAKNPVCFHCPSPTITTMLRITRAGEMLIVFWVK